jgi:hypothetical protein
VQISADSRATLPSHIPKPQATSILESDSRKKVTARDHSLYTPTKPTKQNFLQNVIVVNAPELGMKKPCAKYSEPTLIHATLPKYRTP